MIERAFNGDEMIPVICIKCEIPFKLTDAEFVIIRHAVEVCGGNRTKAAELLGIHVRTLRRKLNGGMR